MGFVSSVLKYAQKISSVYKEVDKAPKSRWRSFCSFDSIERTPEIPPLNRRDELGSAERAGFGGRSRLEIQSLLR
jgi:hypothetical protein